MRILLPVLLLLLLVPSWMGEPRLALFDEPPRITARPVLLDSSAPSRHRVGRLTWLGGIEITGRGAAFGGFSSLYVAGHVAGDEVTLLSDGGNFVRLRIDRAMRIGAVGVGALPAGPGRGWAKRDRDSESMTVDPTTGSTWVGFENSNQIWRYGKGLARAEGHAAPPAMAWWPEGRGAESMALMPGGGMIVIAENDPWPRGRDNGRAAIRFSGDPTRHPRAGFRFTYVPPRGADPSDMAVLPDGDLIVLNRRFSYPFDFSAVLTIVPRTRIKPGATVRGREIATLAAPLIHDNFEGVAITREGRDTIVWIVSDDNQSILERSLLLKFRLDPGA